MSPLLEGKDHKLDYSKCIESRHFGNISFVLFSISIIQVKTTLPFILNHQWSCHVISNHSLHSCLHPWHIKHKIPGSDHDQQRPQCQENTNYTQHHSISQCTKLKIFMFTLFQKDWIFFLSITSGFKQNQNPQIHRSAIKLTQFR